MLTRILIGVFFVLGMSGGHSARAAEFEAKFVSRSPELLRMDPGGTATVTVKFQNSGSTTWTTYSKDFISVYTYGPKYRQSQFKDVSWISPTQPVRLQESIVGPGNQGTVQFRLTAPLAPGNYEEVFALAAEGSAWITGGEFKLQIAVSEPAKSAAAVVRTETAVPSNVTVVPNAPTYSAQLISMSPSKVEMTPGGKASVTLKFRNMGSATWRPRGGAYISAYTHGPKYRQSMFRDGNWYGTTQPALISEAAVEPGGIATVIIPLSAPSVAGEFKESFWLAAESKAWVPGGDFTIPISVKNTVAPQASGDQAAAAGSVPTSTVPASASSKPAEGYGAIKLITSARELKLQEGTTANFRVGFKNTGKKAWSVSGDKPVSLLADAGNAYSFRHSSWPGVTVAARLTGDSVLPGQLAFFDITLAAPTGTGNYVPRFILAAGNDPVDGGTLEFPVEVTQGYTPANIPSYGTAPAPSGPRGPNIRVGLFKTASTVVVASSGAYSLVDGKDHSTVRPLSGITSVTFDPATLLYTVRNGSYEQVFDHHVHLHPDDPANNVFEIQSYSNVPTWDSTLNFNKFRGELEVFYSASMGELWVIEELPLEDYMRGLAETSNASPYEFQKALVTSARTFAFFVQKTGGKHPAQHFDVTTGDGDQVYKGYASELVRPNVVRAVEETRGQVVTLDGDVVATPYFSRSDGRTRAYTEVWGGSTRSWLVSVPTPYDNGKTLWGHGVGMSASDAVARADAGATWDQLIKYYFTGVSITSRY